MEEIDFSSLPVSALNVSSRMRLSWFLDSEQDLPATSGLARDYRGLAEQMRFQYNDIKKFQRSENPTFKVLEACDSRSDITFADLIEFLEKMERHDVIQDLLPKFEGDAKSYLLTIQHPKMDPIQVPEVSSCHISVYQGEATSDLITIDDVKTGKCTIYDAYVSHADANTELVYQFAQFLESPAVNFKLCIRSRDLLLGNLEHKAIAQLILTRCRRNLIFLSPDFLRSPECEFQASIAASLAIEQQRRLLIPILIQPCEIPIILKFISKIDFTKPGIQSWMWERLITSIRDCPGSAFNSQVGNSLVLPQTTFSQVPLPIPTSTSPIITFPPSTTHNFLEAATNSSEACKDCSSNDSVISENKSTLKQKWYRQLRERFPSRNSSASSATSGFYSRSDNVFLTDSTEDSK